MVAVILGPVRAASAGGSKAVPPVQVVPPGGVKLERDDLPPPQLELAKHPAKVNTPVIPAFDLPPGEPGFHGPRELRLHGKSVLGTEVKVKGYVTAIYDCVEGLASANPRVTRAQIE